MKEKKITIEITVTISQDSNTDDTNYSTQNIIDDLTMCPDNTVDGFILTRKGDTGDITERFYIQDAEITNIKQ